MQKIPITQIAIFCARYLAWVMVGVVFLYSLIVGEVTVAFMALVAGTMARGLNEAVHVVYKRNRPEKDALIPKPKNLSFPSGHASFLLGFSFFLVPFWPGIAVGCIGISLVVFFARVYCGVHWTSDLFGSIVNALIAAVLVYQLL